MRCWRGRRCRGCGRFLRGLVSLFHCSHVYRDLHRLVDHNCLLVFEESLVPLMADLRSLPSDDGRDDRQQHSTANHHANNESSVHTSCGIWNVKRWSGGTGCLRWRRRSGRGCGGCRRGSILCQAEREQQYDRPCCGHRALVVLRLGVGVHLDMWRWLAVEKKRRKKEREGSGYSWCALLVAFRIVLYLHELFVFCLFFLYLKTWLY